MIAYIRGTLAEKAPTRAVIEAAGVGYELLIPISTYERLPREGGDVKLLAFHCVREDDEALFGFATADERELFAKLTGVSGVGPKIALAILSGASVGELALAIASEDVKRLAAVKGVGKKTAAKICVELKDKVDALAFAARGPGGAAGANAAPIAADAVAALRALGFGDEVSAKMVTDILAKNPDVATAEQVIKLALSASSRT